MTTLLAYSVDEATEALGIGRSLFYKQVNSGAIRVVKIGSRTLVPAGEIERLLNEYEEAGGDTEASQ